MAKILDQQTTAENAAHNFDLASRKWVSAVLSGDDLTFAIAGPSEKATLAKILNSRRRTMLLEVKRGQLTASNDEDIKGLLVSLRNAAILDLSAVVARPLGD